jgi:hypothetical protein
MCAIGKQQSPISLSELSAKPIMSAETAISSIALLDWQSPAQKDGGSPMMAPPPQVFLVLPVNSRFKGASRALLEDTPEEFLHGHTFEVEGLGRPTLYVDGSSYALSHMYTRTPSEHMLDGKKYDMEVNMHVCHYFNAWFCRLHSFMQRDVCVPV